MSLFFKRLDENVLPPKQAHAGDAGFDLFNPGAEFTLHLKEIKHLKLKIAFQIPFGHVGIIQGKSGLASKNGISTIGNIIDSGYRGEISVTLVNHGTDDYLFKTQDKLCQILILPIFTDDLVEVKELRGSHDGRGSDGFGSTGR